MSILVYGIGKVELALVLGPSTPPLLPVLVLDLLTHADLARRLDSSAVFLQIKLGMLKGPLALAIGVSVSTALYLPTLFAGGGRRLAAATGLILGLPPLLALMAARRLGR